MPESKKRKTAAYVPPRGAGRDATNPRWLVPAIVSLLVGGVGWILVFYISDASLLGIGNYNLLIGFGLLTASFIFLTRWK